MSVTSEWMAAFPPLPLLPWGTKPDRQGSLETWVAWEGPILGQPLRAGF